MTKKRGPLALIIIDGWGYSASREGNAIALANTPFYDELSEKYASSDVTRLRRSDFIAVMYAFCFVLANFGIAIAAKMPMITTTIRSSIRVKPLRCLSMSRFTRKRGRNGALRRTTGGQ